MPPPKNRLLSEDYKMNNETVRLSKGACLLGDRDAGPTTFGPFSKSAKSTNGPFRELFVKKKYIYFLNVADCYMCHYFQPACLSPSSGIFKLRKQVDIS